ncbi:hypothetical protein P9112_009173 [Eukaryota sp. TZLM1-RC]
MSSSPSPQPPPEDSQEESSTFLTEKTPSPTRNHPSSLESTPQLTPHESAAVKSANRSLVRQRMAEFSKATDNLRLGSDPSLVEEHEKRLSRIRQLRQEEKERQKRRLQEVKKRQQELLKQEEEAEAQKKQEEERKHQEYLERIKARKEKAEKERQERRERMKAAEESYAKLRKDMKKNPPLYKVMMEEFQKYYESQVEQERREALDKLAETMKTSVDFESLKSASEEISREVQRRTEELREKRLAERSPPKFLKNLHHPPRAQQVLRKDEEAKKKHLIQLEQARLAQERSRDYAERVRKERKPVICVEKKQEMEELIWKSNNPAPTVQQLKEAPWIRKPVNNQNDNQNDGGRDKDRLPEINKAPLTESNGDGSSRKGKKERSKIEKNRNSGERKGKPIRKTPKQSKSKDNQSKVSQSKDNQSKVSQSKESQLKDNQSKVSQSKAGSQKPSSKSISQDDSRRRPPRKIPKSDVSTARSCSSKASVTKSTTPTPPSEVLKSLSEFRSKSRKIREELVKVSGDDVSQTIEAQSQRNDEILSRAQEKIKDLEVKS